jgi:hypothetical protein
MIDSAENGDSMNHPMMMTLQLNSLIESSDGRK